MYGADEGDQPETAIHNSPHLIFIYGIAGYFRGCKFFLRNLSWSVQQIFYFYIHLYTVRTTPIVGKGESPHTPIMHSHKYMHINYA